MTVTVKALLRNYAHGYRMYAYGLLVKDRHHTAECSELVALGRIEGDCRHRDSALFWRWFAKEHEHRRVALLSGLVEEVEVEWPGSR